MKAAFLMHYDKRGANLEIRDVPEPQPAGGELLVKVKAAGVNPLDNMIIRGEVRLIVPYRTPLLMGNEFVGIVQAAGSGTAGFAEGDRVYGRMPLDHIGTFAEYLTVPADAVAAVPDYLSDEEAACVPLTSLTAMQAYDLMNTQPGGTLYISGGTGSVGAMAIPLAVARGLKVATSGGAASRDRVEALGVEIFIDYKKQQVASVLSNVDYVLDTLGDKALPAEFEILRVGGSLVTLRGTPNGAFARRMGMPWYKQLLFDLAGSKWDRMARQKDQTYNFIFVHADGAELKEVSRIFAERKITPSVDGVFPLEEVNAALAKVAAGGSRGKTVLKIGS